MIGRLSGTPMGAAVALAVGCLVLLPVLTGLWQTVTLAAGIWPGRGAHQFSLAPWRALLDSPGFVTALRVSVLTGVGATALSLALAAGFVTIRLARSARPARPGWLAPLLATPHAAMAIGLSFLLAPSGWIARALAVPFGFDRPPMISTVNDPWGGALIIGLVIKEVPFLLLILHAALTQIPVERVMKAGRALGYPPELVVVKIIWPQVWPLIRLPVLVVLAYSLSVVDMAVVLGPSNPPTLAVLITRLATSPDLSRLHPASAGALLQLALVGVAFAAVFALERFVAFLGRAWLARGARHWVGLPLISLAAIVTRVLMGLSGLALIVLLIWSVAWRWPWPLILPDGWSSRAWTLSSSGWMDALGNTALLALVSTGISLMLAVTWLDAEDRARRSTPSWLTGLIYLPLLVPQVSFLLGLNVTMVSLGVSGSFAAVVLSHVVFVFPYVMITLRDPWRSRDRRLDRAAASLGAGPWRRLFSIKLPVLAAPICAAAAIGVAVSVAQYLPTLFLGGGRIPTLATEAVTLASASDRRVVGVYASLQAALPLFAYVLAIWIPAWLHRDRRALSGSRSG